VIDYHCDAKDLISKGIIIFYICRSFFNQTPTLMIRYLPLLFTGFVVFFCSAVSAQTSLPAITIVTQDFNSIGNSGTATLPANWKISAAGTGATSGYASGTNLTATTQAASSGVPATGGAYNWATIAGSDRAIGFLASASYAGPNSIMAHYRNTTGATVNSVTIAFVIKRYVINSSTASVVFSSSTDGNAWVPETAGDISSADFQPGTNAGTFATPKSIYKIVTANVTVPNNGDIYFRWVFTNTGNTNSQGLGLDDVSVFAGTATPVVTATLKDSLLVDNAIPNQFNEGDVIRYETVIKNTGTGNAGNVEITLPAPPPNTTMVPGSVKTSVVAGDDNYNASFNIPLNGSSVLANDFGVPLPTTIISFGPTSDPKALPPGLIGTTNAGGSIMLHPNGMFTYIPPTNFSGVDQFKYITGNGNLPNNDATVNINVGADITFATTNTDPSCYGGSNGIISFNASGGNGALLYSITGAGGTFQSSNVFTGLSAGNYSLVVKDAGGLSKSGSVTLVNPNLLVINSTIPGLTYNTSISVSAFTKTGGTGGVTWMASGFPTGITLDPSTGFISGTPTKTGIFNAVITVIDANSCMKTANVSFAVVPQINDDTFNAVVGNTQLVADDYSTPATPFTVSATNILANDASDAAITVTPVTNAATTAGGTITINSAGKFIYTPPVGSMAADSYTYTATSNGVSATGTIHFTTSNMVWYVNNTYTGGSGVANGSSARPYSNVAPAASASAASETIYVHAGSGNTTGNAVLKPGQTLRGEGSALSVGALSLAAGTKPTLTGMVTLATNVKADGFDMLTGATTAFTNAGTTVTGVTVNVGNVTTTTGSGITLTGTGNNVNMTLGSLTTNGAANAVNLVNTAGTVTINGGTQTNSTAATFNINGGTVSVTYPGNITQTANAPMVSVTGGHAIGTLTFQTGTLSATNGTGLQFDNAKGTYNFNGTTTLNGGDAGIDILNGSSGTFNFASGIAITNPTGEAIKINGSTANVTYSGSFTKTNNATTGVFINGETGGTININGTGTKTLSTTTGTAINLTNNTGATIIFSVNNLLITTTSGTGFNATGGGTVSVAGTGNIINATSGGTAINVVNTTIGAFNLNFQSISSIGGSKTGIALNNTGSTGKLIVTGVGTTAASGGTISNKTGADGDFANGVGIYFNSTSNPTLSNMQLNDFQNYAVYGVTVSGAAMANMVVNGASGTNDAIDEAAVKFLELTGAATFTNFNVSGGLENNFTIINTAGTLNRVIFSSCTFGANSTLLGNDALFIESSGTATIKTTIQNCNFTASRGDLLQTNFIGNNSSMDLVINGCTFTNNHPNIVSGGGGVTLSGSGTSGNINTPAFTYNISNNTFRDALGTAVVLAFGGSIPSAYTQYTDGKFLNNTIGVQAVQNSGSSQGHGLYWGVNAGPAFPTAGLGKHRVIIDGNSIFQYNNNGIMLQVGDGNSGFGGPDVQITCTANTVNTPGDFGANSIHINHGTTSTDNFASCIDIGSTVPAKKNNVFDIRVRQRQSTTIKFPGYLGTDRDNAAVQSYLAARNNVSTLVTANSVLTGGGFIGGAPCTQPQ
jgi:hypothetical protein